MKLVRALFLIEFLLGAAVAFFSTASLALFLSSFEIRVLPLVYILAAACLFVFILLYARFEARFTPGRLLQLVILFSAVSVLVCWLVMAFTTVRWLPPLLVIWNLVIYMLVGDAFWGMVAMRFNVREGKRLAAIVGAGDLPAKMLGYLSVTALVPFIGVVNLLWVSIACFILAYVLLSAFNVAAVPETEEPAATHAHRPHPHKNESFWAYYFQNNLIGSIAVWALIGYTIFFVLDFTFLSEIKLETSGSHEVATFLSVFFAAGRLLAILFKLIFSSKVIARFGLANSLLVAPVLLFLVNLFILASAEGLPTYMYVFGMMVLLAEVLRATLQDPVAFVLFQPLSPHSRLKGHTIKGYTLPLALFLVGACLTYNLQQYGGLTITGVSEVLFFLLLLWAGSVFLIRKAYLHTLVKTLQKGFFSGTSLFLNDAAVTELLVQKTASAKPQEVLEALNLLERSGYPAIHTLLMRHLKSDSREVKEYTLARIIENNMVGALPLIEHQLEHQPDPRLRPLLIRAQFYLQKGEGSLQALQRLDPACKKEAMIGLLNHPGAASKPALQELSAMAAGNTEEKLLALDIMAAAREGKYEHLVAALLQDAEPRVYTSAITVAGKVKYYPLFKTAAAVAVKTGAYPALQKALLAYGDLIYKAEYMGLEELPEPLLPILLKAAGKIKGTHTTLFLETALKRYPAHSDLVVEALCEKKAALSGETRKLLEAWVAQKLEQNQLKKNYCQQLFPDKAAALLQQAICSEINQDILRILKGLSLVYDQERIERVITLYKLGYRHKLSNAVEMLELLIPNRYFTSLDGLIEFMQDVARNQVEAPPGKRRTTGAIIREILLDNMAGCTSWTRSVACYLIPRLQDKSFPLQLLEKDAGKEDPLFRETRNYVVSMLS